MDHQTHLFTDDVIQVRNADVSFDQRDLIHLLRKGPLLDVVLDTHIIVWCRATLGNENLLWKETGAHATTAELYYLRDRWRATRCVKAADDGVVGEHF